MDGTKLKQITDLYDMYLKMEQRIQAFEILWREHLMVRLSGGLHVDDEYRDILSITKPELRRQDNRHHLLSDDKLDKWFSANLEGKEALMMEYDATEADATG